MLLSTIGPIVRITAWRVPALVALMGGVLVPAGAVAQDPPIPPDSVYLVDPIIVTATRGPRAVSDIPRPVSVMQRRDVAEQQPNSVSDLFRSLPGLDVTGVGVSQVRPQIRGQTGQRILLLSDGLRMNNTRRQRNFGELPALVDVSTIEQVEVVRGPSSVLYGSDAIGGVVNIVTQVPREEGFRGSASFLLASPESQRRFSARVSGRRGAFSLQAGGMARTASSYEAPSGEFGEITLVDEVTVDNSGVDDENFDVRLGWDFSSTVGVFTKFEGYGADGSGFGIVDPAEYAPGDPAINILYPMQRFRKLSAGLEARAMDTPVADELRVAAYGQDNERELTFDTFIPFFPGAGLELDNQNFTDIRTYGFRAEARKRLDSEVQLTYGFDGFQDDAVGTDNNVSTVIGFGPPMVEVSNAPSIPDAQFLSLGAFAQAEFDVGERVSLVGGGRLQRVSAETFATANLTNTPTSVTNSTGVWALNALLEVTDGLDLVVSSGRGFRSPNLVELFFDGAVPEAGAYQLAAPDLKAETSWNVDLGARFQTDVLFLEGFVFRNKVSNGIRGDAVVDVNGDTTQIAGLDAFQNVNLDEIIVRGVELNADARFDFGVELGAGLSTLDAEDAINPDNPVGESFSSKYTGRAGYRDPAGRFWGEWNIRHSGEKKDGTLAGELLVPAFTVQGLRAGARLGETDGAGYSVVLAVNNLTNVLYAEAANASFFRPQPKRGFTLTFLVTF